MRKKTDTKYLWAQQTHQTQQTRIDFIKKDSQKFSHENKNDERFRSRKKLKQTGLMLWNWVLASHCLLLPVVVSYYCTIIKKNLLYAKQHGEKSHHGARNCIQ